MKITYTLSSCLAAIKQTDTQTRSKHYPRHAMAQVVVATHARALDQSVRLQALKERTKASICRCTVRVWWRHYRWC